MDFIKISIKLAVLQRKKKKDEKQEGWYISETTAVK